MSMLLDTYIEIKQLLRPDAAFEYLDGEFADIMYPIHFTENSLIMLLDIDIDPNQNEDILWLKRLLDTVLPRNGETDYVLAPYTPQS